MSRKRATKMFSSYDGKSIRDNVPRVIAEKQSVQKQSYDARRARPKTFGVGQQVLCRTVKTARKSSSHDIGYPYDSIRS